MPVSAAASHSTSHASSQSGVATWAARNIPVRSPAFLRYRTSSAAIVGSSMGIKPTPLGRSGAELGEPIVVGAVAYATKFGILDQKRDDRAVHHRRVDAVPVHVRQAQRRRRRTEHTVLEHAATVDRGPAPAPSAGRAGTPTPQLPPVVRADPGRPVVCLHDFRGSVAPLASHALLPDILRQPL